MPIQTPEAEPGTATDCMGHGIFVKASTYRYVYGEAPKIPRTRLFDAQVVGK